MCRECYVKIAGKAVNHGDLKGIKVPCIIKFVGENHFIDMLAKELQKHELKSFIKNKYPTLSLKKCYIFPSNCLTAHLMLEVLRC